MNDPDDYYRTLVEDRRTRRRSRAAADPVDRATEDPADRAAAAIGEPLSPPDVDRV